VAYFSSALLPLSEEYEYETPIKKVGLNNINL